MIEIEEKGSGIDEVEKWISGLLSENVFVGVPESTTVRDDGPTNAELTYLHTNGVRSKTMRDEMNAQGLPYGRALSLYIFTYGSPLYKIPPRPIIEPAIEDAENSKLLQEQMSNVINGYSESNQMGLQELNKLGLLAEGLVRAWFTNPRNNWAPNAPYTIAQKGSDRPLIDTGSLRKAMTYVIRKG